MMNYKQKKIMPTAKGHFRSDLDILKVGYSEFKSYNLFINNYVEKVHLSVPQKPELLTLPYCQPVLYLSKCQNLNICHRLDSNMSAKFIRETYTWVESRSKASFKINIYLHTN